MDKKSNKAKFNIKLIITILIIAAFIWFIILSPFITFKKNESTLENAAKRYYEINTSEAPTGERVGVITLKQLYRSKIITEDLFVPYTKEPCSVDDSWVKVKKENGKNKYYTYLECGVLSSNVDHKGPEITLNGKDEVTISRGDKYKDAGVASVVDNTDGKISLKDVATTSNVDTSKVGTYEVTYTALDSLKNKTEVTRKVIVVERLKNTVKKATLKSGYYTGANPNNYITFSNMLFRIVDIDGDNVRIVANEDIANVNYNGISKWLDYYYQHLTEKSKKMVVENKYCNMNLTDTTLDTTECSGFTGKMKTYIPSIIEINRAQATDGNFLKPTTMSWTANAASKEEAYLTKNYFMGDNLGDSYMKYSVDENYGVRPLITIKGTSEIISGDGTKDSPYNIGDTTQGKGGQYINKRNTGEYVKYQNMVYRIIEPENDGTTKVISTGTIFDGNSKVEYNYDARKTTIYNPEQSGNVGYSINNRISKYIETNLFVNHKIEVPIYKNKINYGQETQTKTYKVKLSAPNMYEMFSAQNVESKESKSYWMINSSKKQNVVAAVYDLGGVTNQTIDDYDTFGVRIVGYLDKATVISSGKGTYDNPYVINK